MKLVSWNILHGGGARREAICGALAAHNPDVIILSEVRSDSVIDIRSSLWTQQWQYCVSTASEKGVNSLCVLSRTPVVIRDACPVPDENTSRWLDLDLPAYGFGIGAVHIPTALAGGQADHGSMKRFWSAIVQAANHRTAQPFLFIGDMNTGVCGIDTPGTALPCSADFKKMTTLGWTDAWRHFHGTTFEPSWVSTQNLGFRIDHAFASPQLVSRLVGCHYSHAERETSLSDHSMLILDIAP